MSRDSNLKYVRPEFPCHKNPAFFRIVGQAVYYINVRVPGKIGAERR